MRARVARWLYPTAALGSLLLLWEVLGHFGARTADRTPIPTEILASLASDPGFYLTNASATVFEAVSGLIFAVCAAGLVASAFTLSGATRKTLMPLVVVSQTVPLVAVAPLLAEVIGNGLWSRIVVSAWLCWFPAVISITHGMLNVDERLLAVFESCDARPLDIFWKLRVPSSAVSFVSGFRAAAGFALIGAIVVEYSGAPSGLGAFIMAQTIHPTDRVRLFGVVVMASIAGLALTEGTHAIVKWVLRRYVGNDQ